jgi:hypothetical protein
MCQKFSRSLRLLCWAATSLTYRPPGISYFTGCVTPESRFDIDLRTLKTSVAGLTDLLVQPDVNQSGRPSPTPYTMTMFPVPQKLCCATLWFALDFSDPVLDDGLVADYGYFVRVVRCIRPG